MQEGGTEQSSREDEDIWPKPSGERARKAYTRVQHLREAFAKAGFPILKTLKHHMFRFSVSEASLAETGTDPIHLTPQDLQERLAKHPVLTAALSLLPEQTMVHIEANLRYRSVEVQTNPGWNLDRVDQGPKALDRRYGHLYDGQGVHIYVMDSGIRTTHFDFEGRAKFLWNAFNDGSDTGKWSDENREIGTKETTIGL